MLSILDSRTLTVIYVIISVNLILFFALVTSSRRKRYMKLFTIGLICPAMGFLLLSLRGFLNSFLSVIIANFLIIYGALIFSEGVTVLLKLDFHKFLARIVLVVHTLLFLYFFYVTPNVTARIVVLSAELVLIFSYIGWMFVGAYRKKPHPVRAFVAWVYVLNACFYGIRILYTLVNSPEGNFFENVDYLSLSMFFEIVFQLSRTIGVLLYVMIQYDEKLERANKVLPDLSTTDHLTKVKNLRSLMRGLDRELERVKRYDRRVSVAMIDIDHFKNVNDTYGHTIGDEVLIGIAELFQKELRKVDILGRYGGEEFLLILPESTCEEGARLLIRVQQKLKEYEWCIKDLKVTFSAGVFEVNGTNCNSGVKDIIKQADELMYVAKENGRNRVEHSCGKL